MNIGITIWEDQISPLMDAATRLLLVEYNGGAVGGRKVMQLPLSIPWQRVTCIREAGVTLLICGAISREYETMLQSCDIEVMPWIRGNVDEVIEAFVRNGLGDDGYCLPGRMRERRRRRGGRGRRRGQTFGSRFQPEEDQ